jgi:hypothetical protein
MTIDDFTCTVSLFVAVDIDMWRASARQNSGLDTNRQMQELARESIGVQT